jgi:hypothetical protein
MQWGCAPSKVKTECTNAVSATEKARMLTPAPDIIVYVWAFFPVSEFVSISFCVFCTVWPLGLVLQYCSHWYSCFFFLLGNSF